MSLSRRIALGAILPVLVIVIYAIATAVSPNPFFPPIPQILERFVDLWFLGRLQTDVVPSLINFFVGYAIAAALGIVLGLGLGLTRWLAELALPLIHFARNVPALMLIPPLVLLLGVGDESKIAIIALGSFFPILLATIDGVRQTDAGLVDAARSMRLSPWQRFRYLWTPASTPSMFGGLQTGMQFALVLMVASEMVAATRGVGYLTMQAQLTFNSLGVWAGILLLAILGFLLNFLFSMVRRRVLAWHIGMRAQSQAR